MAAPALFRPLVRLAGSAPQVYRLTEVMPPSTLPSWVPQPGSEMPATTTAAEGPSGVPPPVSAALPVVDEEFDPYLVDLSQPGVGPNPFLKALTPLDVIASRLPALPDRVKRGLWTPFVPDKFAPTEWLKDVPPPYGAKAKKYLDLKNGHPLDERVVFIGGLDGIDETSEDDTGVASSEKDEPHRYYIDGSCANIISVTTLLKAFFEPFDAVRQSESTFRTKTFADCKHRPSYKYHGCKSPEDIRAVWKRGARLGTLMHANLEAHFNGEPFVPLKENEKCLEQFRKLFQDTDWVTWEPFRTEWSVFDAETLVAGQIDLAGLLNRERSELVLIDWKRSERISDCSFARFSGAAQAVGGCAGHGPCRMLEDCNFIHYSLQLNLYAYLLWKNYGYTTKKMYILQFHPKNKDNLAGVFQAPVLTSVVEEMMAARKIVLQQHGVRQKHDNASVSPPQSAVPHTDSQ